jgi:hypothetical protein
VRQAGRPRSFDLNSMGDPAASSAAERVGPCVTSAKVPRNRQEFPWPEDGASTTRCSQRRRPLWVSPAPHGLFVDTVPSLRISRQSSDLRLRVRGNGGGFPGARVRPGTPDRRSQTALHDEPAHEFGEPPRVLDAFARRVSARAPVKLPTLSPVDRHRRTQADQRRTRPCRRRPCAAHGRTRDQYYDARHRCRGPMGWRRVRDSRAEYSAPRRPSVGSSAAHGDITATQGSRDCGDGIRRCCDSRSSHSPVNDREVAVGYGRFCSLWRKARGTQSSERCVTTA